VVVDRAIGLAGELEGDGSAELGTFAKAKGAELFERAVVIGADLA